MPRIENRRIEGLTPGLAYVPNRRIHKPNWIVPRAGELVTEPNENHASDCKQSSSPFGKK